MKEQFGDLDVVIAPVGLVIGSHCGLVRLVLFSIVLKNNLKITKNAFRGVFLLYTYHLRCIFDGIMQP